jgi:hypothetical protein
MSDCPEPKWQPIDHLPLLAFMVDKLYWNTVLASYQLQDAAIEARSMDAYDEVAIPIVELCKTQVEYLWFFEEQFARWQAESLGVAVFSRELGRAFFHPHISTQASHSRYLM